MELGGRSDDVTVHVCSGGARGSCREHEAGDEGERKRRGAPAFSGWWIPMSARSGTKRPLFGQSTVDGLYHPFTTGTT